MSTIINLTFHGIGLPQRHLDPGEQQVWISEKNFLSILDLVKDRPNVKLTFDDGNISDVNLALPALIERNLAAEFFVLAGYVDKPNYLNAEYIRSLLEAGMKIGLHGMNHCSWRAAKNGDLNEELFVAREKLQDIINQNIKNAACPFGEYDRRTLKTLKQAGFKHIYTSDRGKADENDWLQARNTVTCDDNAKSIAELIDNNEGMISRSIRKSKLLAKRLH